MRVVYGRWGREYRFDDDELADIESGVRYNFAGYSTRELSEEYSVSPSVIRRVVQQIFAGEIGPYSSE
jgi:hypothetical protein